MKFLILSVLPKDEQYTTDVSTLEEALEVFKSEVEEYKEVFDYIQIQRID